MISITIIVPVYNVELYIRDCLLSVCNQTYTDIECIIVNDATPDNSMAIVEDVLKFYKGDVKFKVINHKKNQGLSAARNTGVSEAKGDYVFFLDSDDELMPEAIQLMVNKLVSYNSVDFLVGGIKVVGSNVCYLLKSNEYLPSNIDVLTDFLKGKYYVMACGKLIKKGFLEKYSINFVNGILHEDILYSFLLAYYAQNAIVMQQDVYIYKIRTLDSISSLLKKKNFDDIFYSMSIRFDLLENRSDLNEHIRNEYVLTSCFRLLPLLYKSRHMITSQDYISFDKKIKDMLRIHYMRKGESLMSKMLLFSLLPTNLKICIFKLYYFSINRLLKFA